MIRVLLVDDQNTTRQILKSYLEPEPDLEIVGNADDGQAAIEQIEVLQPDVALVDIEMPGIDGLTATRMISQRFPTVKVIVLSTYDDSDYVNRALQVGAKGYLLKATPAQEIASVIRSVSKGYFQLGPGLLEKFLYQVSESRNQELIHLREQIREIVAGESHIDGEGSTLSSLDGFPSRVEYDELAHLVNQVMEQQRLLKVQFNTFSLRAATIERQIIGIRSFMTTWVALSILAVFGYIWLR
jgi:DNA-binding NarL/FixJ family response regulator